MERLIANLIERVACIDRQIAALEVITRFGELNHTGTTFTLHDAAMECHSIKAYHHSAIASMINAVLTVEYRRELEN